MEPRVVVKTVEVKPLPLRPYMEKKIKVHKHTAVARSKPMVITRENPPNPKLK